MAPTASTPPGTTGPVRVLHLAPLDAWRRGQVTGEYRGSTLGAGLDEVGYVHASTANQLPRVVDAVYRGVDLTDHVLLVVDAAGCEASGSPVRWEAPPEGAPPYPHVHGPVPVSAVVAVLGVGRDPAGAFVLPDLAGLEVALDPPAS